MTVPPVTDSAQDTAAQGEQDEQDKMDQTATMEFSGTELGLLLNSLSVAIGVLQQQDVHFALVATAGTAMKLGPARTQALLDKLKAKLDESFTDPAKGIRTVSDEEGPALIADFLGRAARQVISRAAEAAMQQPINKEVA